MSDDFGDGVFSGGYEAATSSTRTRRHQLRSRSPGEIARLVIGLFSRSVVVHRKKDGLMCGMGFSLGGVIDMRVSRRCFWL